MRIAVTQDTRDRLLRFVHQARIMKIILCGPQGSFCPNLTYAVLELERTDRVVHLTMACGETLNSTTLPLTTNPNLAPAIWQWIEERVNEQLALSAPATGCEEREEAPNAA